MIEATFSVENIGDTDGSEVVQVYISDPESVVAKPEKELKAFEKVFLRAGESRRVRICIPTSDIAYYNMSLHDWVVENGVYKVLIGTSSVDIRLSGEVDYCGEMPYTMKKLQDDTVG